jgi:CelD/BcsL family acetyltransferase involved in cellulose biosynthesis
MGLSALAATISTGAPGALTLERHQRLDAIRDEWTELAERCGHPFATWEWAATWWDHFGDDRPLQIIACRRPDGTLAAVLPLYLSTRGPLRMARFLGHGVGDVLGPICASEDAALAAPAVRQILAEEGQSWDLLLAERMPKDMFSGLLPGRVLQEEANPVLPIDGASWDEFLASCSSNLRSQIRRKRRKLEREQGSRFRLADDRARLDEDFDTLLRLHSARWGEARAFSEQRSAFHRDFAARALEHGWLRLWLLEVDGQAVAAWLGYRFGDVEWYYQSGRDPAWDGWSVGLVLLTWTMQAAFDDGMSGYAFLRGDEDYKRRFATHDAGLVTVGVPRGPLGRAAISAAGAAKRMPPSVRDRVLSSLG